jgi:hypothetical protein
MGGVDAEGAWAATGAVASAAPSSARVASAMALWRPGAQGTKVRSVK